MFDFCERSVLGAGPGGQKTGWFAKHRASGRTGGLRGFGIAGIAGIAVDANERKLN